MHGAAGDDGGTGVRKCVTGIQKQTSLVGYDVFDSMHCFGVNMDYYAL